MALNASDLARLGPAAQRQILAKLGQQQKEKSKYHAVKDSRGEIKFDSKKEARRYDELMLRLRAGRIKNLKLQPQFTLQESYLTPDGKRVRAIRYVADFSYFDFDLDRDVVEDTKGVRTDTYKLKRKLMLEHFGIEIHEV